MNDRHILNEVPSFDVACPDCGSSRVTTTFHSETLKVLTKDSEVETIVTVPVRKCSMCQTEFTDDEADKIRHEAACHAKGLLSPKEIIRIRESLGLSRSEFAGLTGIGEASIARWERGELIQNESNDSLIYLASFFDNIERLRKRETQGALAHSESLYIQTDYKYLNVEVTPDLKHKARMFSLTRRGVATCTL